MARKVRDHCERLLAMKGGNIEEGGRKPKRRKVERAKDAEEPPPNPAAEPDERQADLAAEWKEKVGKPLLSAADLAGLLAVLKVASNSEEEAQKKRRRKKTDAERGFRVVKVAGDGVCLFHAFGYGLGLGTTSGRTVRARMMHHYRENPRTPLGALRLSGAIRGDYDETVAQYTAAVLKGRYGGGIELAMAPVCLRLSVEVYERAACGGLSFLTECLGADTAGTVRLLYNGHNHYDVVELV
jgi:hypothetical protein